MYAPDRFRERRPEVLVAAIESLRFATVVGCAPDGPEAVHVPLIAMSEGDRVWLEGHVSKKNPFAHLVADGTTVLAIVNGPHGYVSPRWMKEPEIPGRTAPTWAYIAVQAKGAIEWCLRDRWLREHVARLTERAEQAVGSDWSASLMPDDYASALIQGIAGFRIEVNSLEGMWKVMQHADADDRAGIVAAMRTGSAEQVLMADAIDAGVSR